MTTNEYVLIQFAAFGLAKSLSKTTIRIVQGKMWRVGLAKHSPECRAAIQDAVKIARKIFLTNNRKLVIGINKKALKDLERRFSGKKHSVKKFILESLVSQSQRRQKPSRETNTKFRSGFSSGGARAQEERAAMDHDQRMRTDVAYRQEQNFHSENDNRFGG